MGARRSSAWLTAGASWAAGGGVVVASMLAFSKRSGYVDFLVGRVLRDVTAGDEVVVPASVAFPQAELIDALMREARRQRLEITIAVSGDAIRLRPAPDHLLSQRPADGVGSTR
jgi:hypothetical protein